MEYLCLNCGEINEISKNLSCEKCATPIKPQEYLNIISYSKNAVQYGYRYRKMYEEQVKENGEVVAKYSITEPSDIWQWLAAAVVGGFTGNLVYDIVKHITIQILKKLNLKKQVSELDIQEEEMLKLIKDDKALVKFIVYINAYYKGMPKVNEKVKKAILEEELVHGILDNPKDEDFKAIFINDDGKKSNDQILKDLLTYGAGQAWKKRKQKPKNDETIKLLKGLKKDLKSMKKKSKKSKSK